VGRSTTILAVLVSVLSLRAAGATEPTISETLDWMESTYNNHLHTGGSPGHGLLEIFTEDNKPFEKVQETISSAGCNFTLKKDYVVGLVGQHSDSFSLSNVDPSPIKIDLFHKARYSTTACRDPDDQENFICDFAVVKFAITNQKPLITTDSGNQYSDDNFLVDDIEYAERFAKAFRHAVELCGGKASPF
jgi:hypothetical protein